MTEPARPILVVDDNEVERRMLELCHDRAEITVPLVLFADAEDVLSYMSEARAGRALPPSVLLVDVRMPAMDGFTLVTKLQQSGATLPPVVFITTSQHPADATRAASLGAVLFTKPRGVDAYVAFLRSLPGVQAG